MSPRRHPGRRQALAWMGSAALPWARSVQAADAPFPERAVRIVVPYSVGIGPDVVARGLAEQLQQRWHQPVIVDNRPGASGIIAFSEVRRTPADGHTLFLADTATLAVNPLLHASLPYDPVKDLQPLTLLFRATFLLWVAGQHRAQSLGELLAAARASPGAVSYASLGHGHASQVAVESFAHAAGVRLLHVPFKDAGSLFTAVAAGDVDFTAFSVNTVAGLYARGKLRPLCVAAAARLPAHPEVPTIAEAGGPPVVMHPWAALVTVAGTPAPVVARLRADLAEALASRTLHERTEQAGFELIPSTPEALRERAAIDMAQVRPLLAEGRISRL